MTLVRGIDVSRYQTVTSWSSVKASGVGFAVVKATEGTGSVSSTWRKYSAGARRAGLLVGSYHFGHPRNSPTAEARHYVDELRAVGWKSGRDLPPVLDIEATEGKSKAALTDWCLTFVREVDRLLNLDEPWLRCGFYCNRDYYNSRFTGSQVHSGRWLWLAAWPNPSGPWPTADNSIPAGAALWQWSDRVRLPGIRENCDANVARLAELQQLAPAHYGTAPEPTAQKDWFDMATKADLEALFKQYAPTYAKATWEHDIGIGPAGKRLGGYTRDTYAARELLAGGDAYGRAIRSTLADVLNGVGQLAKPMDDQAREALASSIAEKVDGLRVVLQRDEPTTEGTDA